MEPTRSSAYDEDLRWRMVWQREALGHSYEVIAKNLCVDKSTVWRTVALFQETGQVTKKPYPKERAFRKLTTPGQLLIFHLVCENPGITLTEIQSKLKEALILDVSISTVFRCLRNNGFTLQRLRISASQRDEFLRQKYVLDVSVYSPEMLVFVDETGADRRNILRKYGYSMRGKPLSYPTMLVRGERVSAIACISLAGLLDVMTLKGTTDGDDFYKFVQTHLLPHLLPFNGVNPHSVVILDNCSIHHVAEIAQSIEDVGAIVHYLPPYSPDFNPIEEAFSKVKTVLKSTEEMSTIDDVETLLLASFTQVTQEDCEGWISHSGIYNI